MTIDRPAETVLEPFDLLVCEGANRTVCGWISRL
jgi:hypothetical protein